MRWSPGRHLGPRPRSRDRLRALLRPPERQRDRYHRHRHCARRRRTHRGALGRAGPLRRARADRRPGQALVTSPTAAGRADVPDVATGSASGDGVQLAERLVRDQFRIIETGELELATSNVTAGYVNHRSVHEPLAARAGGPAALAATATWLRRAFSDIRFEIHEIAVIHDRAIAWVTLHGTHTGPFVVHDSPDGAVTGVNPPTGRPFATRQVHWFRIEDGAIAEHDAVRDDLGMAQQVGWIPPRPGFVLRMLVARRRERRAWARAQRGTGA